MVGRCRAAGALTVLAVVALAAGGCNDEEEGETTLPISESFVRGDLESLVPAPEAAPRGTELNRDYMGYGALKEKALGARWVRQLRKEGMQADYLVQFTPVVGEGDRFVETMAFLFGDQEAAEGALALVREQNVEILDPSARGGYAPGIDLGKGAWGLSGEFGAARQVTTTFGFATGNVIQVSTWAGEPAFDNAIRAYAQALHMKESALDQLGLLD